MSKSSNYYEMQKLVSKVRRIRKRKSNILQVLILSIIWLGKLRLQRLDGIYRLHSDVLRFPRLDPGQITKPYVASLGGIAHADAVRLLDERARQLSNMARRVEDPVSVKINLGEVSFAISVPYPTHEENIPINT